MTVKLPGSQPCFLSLSSSARLRAYLPTGTLHGSCPLCSTSGQDPTVDHLLSLTAFFPGETSGTSGMSGCLVSLTFLQIPPAVFPHLQVSPVLSLPSAWPMEVSQSVHVCHTCVQRGSSTKCYQSTQGQHCLGDPPSSPDGTAHSELSGQQDLQPAAAGTEMR
jgi:hypothetical protein